MPKIVKIQKKGTEVYPATVVDAVADKQEDGSFVNLGDILNAMIDESGKINDKCVDKTSAQTISGKKTFSTQQSFTVAQGTSPFTVVSNTAVANLNADMLDGTHKDGLFTSLANSGNNISVTVGGVNKTLIPAYASKSGDADTLDGVHLNGVFTGLANSGNNLSLTIGGVNKTLTPAYATNAGTAENTNLLDGLDSSYFIKGVGKGSYYKDVVNISYHNTAKEILIKTKIPFTSSAMMPLIHLEGYAYGASSPIELRIAFYIYNNYFTSLGCTSTCPWDPAIKLFTYTENNTKYVGIALIKDIYFPQCTINYIDVWGAGSGVQSRNYSTGWTVEYNSTTTSIVPTTDLATVPYKSIANNITGSSSSCTGNAATATQLQTARSINGTSFNGTSAITTANWGTARSITIGSSKKSVNGSADVSWTLTEIGAAPIHDHPYLPLAGNAVSATKLATARTIAGVNFDGTANIAIPFTNLTSKPTTISEYGITDAKIASGIITLGANTITPLTAHQTVVSNDVLLDWGKGYSIATIGGKSININMPANPNTDTHYTNTFKVQSNSTDVVTYSQNANKVINFKAGSNVTLTPDTTNGAITIASTNTTYSTATTSANGLMTAAMVTKLNGIATGANAYTLPTATSTVLGGVKYGTTSGTACEGDDSRLSNSRPASDVSAWAKAATKPTYTYSEVGAAAASHGNHVPTVQTASNSKFLRNDNTWQTVTPANIGAATSGHTHSYLPLAGGTLTGSLTINNTPCELSFQPSTYKKWITTAEDSIYRVWLESSSLGTSPVGIPVFTANSDGLLSATSIKGTSGVYDGDNRVYSANNKPSYSNITDTPLSLKNPTSLTIQTNGTFLGSYDGSAAKTFNITPSGIGAATNGHTHSYAGSGSVGGSATSAVKLDTATAGSATQPVYFSGGKPVATTYTLSKSVPSNAVFTDTNTWRGIQDNLTSTSATDSLSANQGKVLKGLVDGKAASSHTQSYTTLTGAGSTANQAILTTGTSDVWQLKTLGSLAFKSSLVASDIPTLNQSTTGNAATATTATNSTKLNGQAASYYATSSAVNVLASDVDGVAAKASNVLEFDSIVYTAITVQTASAPSSAIGVVVFSSLKGTFLFKNTSNNLYYGNWNAVTGTTSGDSAGNGVWGNGSANGVIPTNNKLYICKATSTTYRWDGTYLVDAAKASENLALNTNQGAYGWEKHKSTVGNLEILSSGEEVSFQNNVSQSYTVRFTGMTFSKAGVYRVSFDVSGDDNNASSTVWAVNEAGTASTTAKPVAMSIKESEYTHYSGLIAITEANAGAKLQLALSINKESAGALVEVYVKNLMVTEGNIEYPYKPAPSDAVSNKILDYKPTLQFYIARWTNLTTSSSASVIKTAFTPIGHSTPIYPTTANLKKYNFELLTDSGFDGKYGRIIGVSDNSEDTFGIDLVFSFISGTSLYYKKLQVFIADGTESVDVATNKLIF